jgi:hypothetical protein
METKKCGDQAAASGLDELFLNLEETKVGVSKIPIFYLIYCIRAPNNS